VKPGGAGAARRGRNLLLGLTAVRPFNANWRAIKEGSFARKSACSRNKRASRVRVIGNERSTGVRRGRRGKNMVLVQNPLRGGEREEVEKR